MPRGSHAACCVRSPLTCEAPARRLPAAATAGAWPRGELVDARRGGRHHRRPVDRRAGHAADDAHLPHRWCRRARTSRRVCRASRSSSRRACRRGRPILAEIDGVVEIVSAARTRRTITVISPRRVFTDDDRPAGGLRGRASSTATQVDAGQRAAPSRTPRATPAHELTARMAGSVNVRGRIGSSSRYEDATSASTPCPPTARLKVEDGQQVHAGDQLTEGSKNPQDMLRHPGPRGGAALPGRRGAEGLPLAGREHQRQAHRSDRAADAAQGAHRARRATPSCCRRAGRPLRRSRSINAACWPRAASRRRPRPVLLGVTKAALNTESASWRRPPSRRRRGC